MADTRGSSQERLVATRRKQILAAALHVFSKQGFHRATVRDVARAAGVADGTIYIYFANKTELLLGLLDQLNETSERDVQLAAGSEGDFRAFFASYLRQRMMILWPNARVFQAVLPELLANAELRDLYFGQVIAPTTAVAERYLGAEMARGRMRPMDVALTVRAIAGTVFGLLILQLLGDAEIAARWEELPDMLATLLLDGLLAESGE
jgi:AcrR family transcriptional regulator